MIRLTFGLLPLLAISISPCSLTHAGEVEFSIDVMSILSKSGCNAGTCHGNLNGKGGFKLSLRGQDPAFDFYALAFESRGRRMSRSAPEQSLFLQKATGTVPHRGGIRFDTNSQEYEILLRWFHGGAKGPSEGALRSYGLRSPRRRRSSLNRLIISNSTFKPTSRMEPLET